MLNTHDLDYKAGIENASILRNVANDLIAKYLLEKYNITIEFSTKMKLSGGSIQLSKKTMNVRIKLNYSYLNMFGIDNIIRTLKHEFAHLIQHDRRGKTGHNAEFKAICARIGGSMNPQMAGTTYAASATDEWAEREFKWSYTCPTCGKESKRVRRMPIAKRTSTKYGCTKCRTTVNKFIEKEL